MIRMIYHMLGDLEIFMSISNINIINLIFVWSDTDDSFDNLQFVTKSIRCNSYSCYKCGGILNIIHNKLRIKKILLTFLTFINILIWSSTEAIDFDVCSYNYFLSVSKCQILFAFRIHDYVVETTNLIDQLE